MNYIGIDLGGTNIKGALVSAKGEILKEHSIPTRVDLGPEAVAGRIGQVIAQLSIGEDTVGGVGVGCPGTVDDASGIVRFAANLNFVNFDLRSALRAHTALPIHLGNDANAAALGEALFGCGRGAESTIVVTLGTGVGGGVVLGGKLLTGYTGAASEIGHMVIAENGEECTCGSRGCFEAYSSATALIRDTKRTMAVHPESLLHAIAAGAGRRGRPHSVSRQRARRRGGRAGRGGLHRASGLRAHKSCQHFLPRSAGPLGRRSKSGRRAAPAAARKGARAFVRLALCRLAHAHRALHGLGYRAGVIGAAMLARE